MVYCRECGKELKEDSKFCANCGTAVSKERDSEKRKTIYEGEIYKCPNCGELLKAFDTVCPSCKYELRDVKSSKAIKSFEDKLQQAGSDYQKISIIKEFIIPNSIEDIKEFMILAYSNFDAKYYAKHQNEEDISDAWLAKIEQCYQKARFSTNINVKDLDKIQEIYNEIKLKCKKENKKINNEKKLKNFFVFGCISCILIGFIFIFLSYKILQVVGLVFIVLGIVLLRNRKKITDKTSKVQDVNANKNKGFKSWNIGLKILWVILNIYTLGIPAIIYVCAKKGE